ncbi:hypothetical protein NQ317_015631 [Molorchus minor]|uniref:Uncharacterized protein n=1 Tax=Molorchus minor TaxID=1323400 RepID=A0ABQ9JV20_9CUCU|nr:hypothetical protein NQ317_015631 [Molorchus minor]
MTEKLRRYRALRQSCIKEVHTLHNLALEARDDRKLRTLFKIRFGDSDSVREEFVKQHANIILILSNDETADFDAEDKLKEDFNQAYYTTKSIYAEFF